MSKDKGIVNQKFKDVNESSQHFKVLKRQLPRETEDDPKNPRSW
jgi:hypothetical protein